MLNFNDTEYFNIKANDAFFVPLAICNCVPKRHIDVFSDPEHSVGNVHLLLISPKMQTLYQTCEI